MKSRFLTVCVLTSALIPSPWMMSHVHAFDFGGVFKKVVEDKVKQKAAKDPVGAAVDNLNAANLQNAINPTDGNLNQVNKAAENLGAEILKQAITGKEGQSSAAPAQSAGNGGGGSGEGFQGEIPDLRVEPPAGLSASFPIKRIYFESEILPGQKGANRPEFKNYRQYKDDIQSFSQIANACVYYDAYLNAIAQGSSEADCNKTYDAHMKCAQLAVSFWDQTH